MLCLNCVVRSVVLQYYRIKVAWEAGAKNKKLRKRQRKRIRREKLAGFFFNLAQVSFTVLSLGLAITFVKEELYDNILLIVLVSMGIILTVLFAKIGNNILR